MSSKQHYQIIAAVLGLSLLFAGRDAAFADSNAQERHDRGDRGKFAHPGNAQFSREAAMSMQSAAPAEPSSRHVRADKRFKIDRGERGTWVHNGKFLVREPQASERASRGESVSRQAWIDEPFHIDRGERGTWVHNGRFLYRKPMS
jgi:hypothetical protein